MVVPVYSMNSTVPSDNTAQNALAIRLLGPPRIDLNGSLLHFESRKAVALIAFLASSAEPRPRAEIATLLWPESDTKRARGALRYTLSIVRKALDGEWFQSDRTSIGLIQSERCVIDTVRFQTLAQSGQDHMHTADTACLDCVENLDAAVALYQDDFLTGFGLRDSVNFDEWQFFQAETFRNQLTNTLRALARYHTQQADYHQALTYTRRLLYLDPLQESIQRRMMQLYVHNGQWQLALEQYDKCVQLLDEELGVAPSPATTQLYEEIRAHRTIDPSLVDQRSDNPVEPSPNVSTIAQPTRPHNLSVADMPLLGRAQEINEICGLLQETHCRMVTLIGPGGIGKTRLAHQIAIDLCNAPEPHFAEAIYFVPLVAADTADLLVTAIADALGLTFNGPQTPKDQLIQYVHEKRLLLVLDNFEQVVSAAPLLTELFNAANGIKLLITSRERLNLEEEWLYEIRGLPLPPIELDAKGALDSKECAESMRENGAVQLFYHRARRLDPRFNLEESLQVVVQICRLLQGMPLGIELAAGWVRTFSVEEIARQIQKDLDFLATPSQNVPERHRSLRAVFLHSWRGLSAKERLVFAKAAIFRGGFSLDAAMTVIDADPMTLGALVDKSMIQRLPRRENQPDRYTIHELLRQYAEATLEPPQREEACRQHCEFFANWVESRLPYRALAEEDAALTEIGAELDNIRSAWNWLAQQIESTPDDDMQRWLAQRMSQFVPMLAYYYLRYSRYEEGRQLFLLALRTMQNATWAEGTFDSSRFHLAQVEARLAEFAFNLSDFHDVIETYTRLMPLFRQANEAIETGLALAGLGKTFIRMGRYADAEPVLMESLEIFRSTYDAVGIIAALNSLGILYSNQGLFEEAAPYYEEFLAISRRNQYARGMSNALNNLGSNYARAGAYEEAWPLYEESYRLALATSERLMIAAALSNLGSVSRALQHYEASRRYYADSLSICREIGERRWTAAGLNGLGLALIDSNCPEKALPHLTEGLTIAHEIESLPDILDALSALADVFVQQDNLSLGIPILRFVLNHPVTQTLSRMRSQALIDQIDPQLVITDESDFDHTQIDKIIELVTKAVTVHLGRKKSAVE